MAVVWEVGFTGNFINYIIHCSRCPILWYNFQLFIIHHSLFIKNGRPQVAPTILIKCECVARNYSLFIIHYLLKKRLNSNNC